MMISILFFLFLSPEVRCQNSTTPTEDRICIPLNTSKACPGLNVYSVLSTSDFKSVSALDTYIQSQSPSNPEYVSKFKSTFDCPNYSPSMERYHSSVLCFFLVSVSMQQCPPSSPPVLKSGHVLCQPVCKAYLNSISSVFSNPSTCNPSPSANVSALRNEVLAPNTSGFADFCSSLPNTSPLSPLLSSSSGSCQGGLASELKNCGFLTADQGKAYCASNTNDTCCWPGPKAGVPPFPLGPPSDIPWLGALAGAVFLMLLFPLFYVLDKFCVPSKPPQMAFVQKIDIYDEDKSLSGDSVGSSRSAGSHHTRKRNSYRVSYIAVDRLPTPRNVVSPVAVPSSLKKAKPGKSNLGKEIASPSFKKSPTVTTSPSSSIRSKRTSSIAALPLPSAGSSSKQLTSFNVEEGYAYTATVTLLFHASEDDEVSLMPGQRIRITEAYDDGWGVGTIHSTGETGVFPLRATDAPEDLHTRFQ